MGMENTVFDAVSPCIRRKIYSLESTDLLMLGAFPYKEVPSLSHKFYENQKVSNLTT